MAQVDDFLDYVSMYAPDIADDILRFTIQEAVTDFLIRTQLLTDYYRFDAQDGVNDYVIDVPKCHTLLRIKRVKVGDPCTQVVDWDTIERTVEPDHTGYFVDLENEGMPSIWLGVANSNLSVELQYVYTIKRGSCEIPDFIHDKYASTIQSLILSKLYNIPGQEWTNPQLAIQYQRMYDKDVADIIRRTSKVVSGPLKAKPFLAGTRSITRGFFV